MSRTPPPPRSGLTGLLFVFALTSLLFGLGFDLIGDARMGFWIGDQAGAATAVGIACVLIVIVAAQAMRWALGRGRVGNEGSANANPDA